jgi:NADPH2:quinone reductase
MRALVAPRFGPANLMEPRRVRTPAPGDGEVLIQVHAVGVNPVDAGNRADGSWARIAAPLVPGYEGAGFVAALGEGVSSCAVGEEVLFLLDFVDNPNGCYAEYTIARADLVVRKPPRLSMVEAAAVPLAGSTAYEAIVRRLMVASGETVLILGAVGGVGSFATQLVAAVGARAIAVTRTGNHELAFRLGAQAAIDYQTDDVAGTARELTDGQGVDVVADFTGSSALLRALPALRERGRVATVVELHGDFDLLVDRNATFHGVLLRPERSLLEAVVALTDEGKLHPVVESTLPLEEVAAAHRRLESGHGFGKIVLVVQL